MSQVAETDSAQTTSPRRTRALGLLSEFDSATALKAAKLALLGLVSEFDTAQSVTPIIPARLGLVVPGDSLAGGLSKSEALAAVAASETSSGLVVTTSP